MVQATTPSFVQNFGGGFQLGTGIRQLGEQRKAQQLGAQQRELLGGFIRTGLGQAPGERTEVRRQTAGQLGPEALKKLDETLTQFDAPQLAKVKEENDRFVNASTNALQFNNAQLPQGLIETASAFDRLGGPANQKAANQTRQLAELAKRNPEAARAQLTALQNSALTAQQAISNRQKNLGLGAEADFTKGKEFVTKGKNNSLILNTSTFNKRTGKSEINRTPITEKLVNELGETGSEETLRLIEQAGGKSGAQARATLSVKAADEAAKQVVTIDAGVRLLDEGITELKAGADVGILDKFLPSIKEASSRFDNVADRMGLQVVQSVTFGALSAGELRVAMATAVPPNLDNKQLVTWFEDRKAAQLKLRSFYVDIARKASQEGKTPAEIMIEIEDEKAKKAVKKASAGQNKAALEWAKANPNDPRAAVILRNIGAK